MFPVCTKESSFKAAKRGNRIAGIAVDAEALIKSLQPYTHTDSAEHWLAILDKLANINKHRRLLLTALSGFSISGLLEGLEAITNGSGIATTSDIIHNTEGAKILSAKQVKMQGDFLAFVAFNEGAVKDMEVGLVVETYIGLVTTALEAFGHFFV